MTIALNVTHYGQGPDVVLVHGWGLHAGVWSGVAQRLAPRFRVHAIDLPGHGASLPARFTLASLAEALLATVPTGAIWVGWSLGALACMQASVLRPLHVRRLALVGATPRFVAAPDWPHAVSPETWNEFGEALQRDPDKTLTRFLSLQFGAGDAERDGLRRLRADLYARGRPDAAALHDGLNVLQTCDLRDRLGGIVPPALVVHGERDRLAPPAAGEFLAHALPSARYHAIPTAGHAPFVSQFDAFMNVFETFLRA